MVLNYLKILLSPGVEHVQGEKQLVCEVNCAEISTSHNTRGEENQLFVVAFLGQNLAMKQLFVNFYCVFDMLVLPRHCGPEATRQNLHSAPLHGTPP
jgi:hypothetical protein